MLLVPLDFETTSKHPATTRGVQLAAIAIDLDTGACDTIIDTITNPGVDIHHEAAEIHGITTEMCQGKVRDHIAATILYDWLAERKDQVILATHNGTTFDLPILWRLAAEGDHRARPPLHLPHIDTLVAGTRFLPDQPSFKLVELVKNLGLGSGDGAHDAFEDLLMVFDLVQFYVSRSGMSHIDMAKWCSVGRVLSKCHFGKNRGKPWGTEPGCVPKSFVRRWITELWTDATPDMIATMRHHYGLTFDFIKRERASR